MMIKTTKLLSSLLLALTLVACENGNGEADIQDAEEDMVVGMEEFWLEQRQMFIERAELQLEEWEQIVQEYDNNEAAADIESDIEHIRDRLNELEQTERAEWEGEREDIASELNELRNKIEALD